MSEQKFIYHMKDLRKIVPPKREILKGIYLSFFPGAKIGVVGPNGSGKSSLIRIMAGVDTDFQGEAWAAKGTRIGYLPQEPELDPQLDVRGNVEEGVRHTRDLLRRFEEVSGAFAEIKSDEEMQALIEEQARLQDGDRRGGRLGAGAQARNRDGRPPPAPTRQRRDDPVRRRATTSRAVQGPPSTARHAPAR